jgi:hypothetical protein
LIALSSTIGFVACFPPETPQPRANEKSVM